MLVVVQCRKGWKQFKRKRLTGIWHYIVFPNEESCSIPELWLESEGFFDAKETLEGAK